MPSCIATSHVVFGLGGLEGSFPVRPNVACGLNGLGFELAWLLRVGLDFARADNAPGPCHRHRQVPRVAFAGAYLTNDGEGDGKRETLSIRKPSPDYSSAVAKPFLLFKGSTRFVSVRETLASRKRTRQLIDSDFPVAKPPVVFREGCLDIF